MKTAKRFVFPLFLLSFLAAFLFQSCQKNDAADNSGRFTLLLTDGPGDYSSVNIDLKYVEIKVDSVKSREHDDHAGDKDRDDDDHGRHRDEYGKWDTLAYAGGVYDLLSLRNGLEKEIGSQVVNGVVRKIRFTLGENSTVVKDGVTYPLLTVPGNTNKYLYVNLNEKHRHRKGGNDVNVWVDFDLGKSIVEVNGKYYLKPVLKPFCDKNFASVAGNVLPADAKVVVKVYNSSDTAIAIPFRDGNFKVRALNPGTYTVLFDSNNGYQDKTVTGVVVETGKTTKLEAVTLKK